MDSRPSGSVSSARCGGDFWFVELVTIGEAPFCSCFSKRSSISLILRSELVRLNPDELPRSPLAICIAPVLSWRDADAEPAGGHAAPSRAPTPVSFIWTMFDEVA